MCGIIRCACWPWTEEEEEEASMGGLFGGYRDFFFKYFDKNHPSKTINLERFWVPSVWRDSRLSASAAQLGPVMRHVYTFDTDGKARFID